MNQMHECMALEAHQIAQVAGGMGDGYCGNGILTLRPPKPDPQPWSVVAVSALGNVVSPAGASLGGAQSFTSFG